MDRANDLIEQLLSNPDSSEFGALANELLTQYHRGSPVGSLRILLHSANDRVVGEGAWIASELGESGKPLLPDISRLLRHPSKKVRFWSIDCVHLWAGPSSADELASAVGLVDDPEEAVRWKAMGFLAMASREQLQAALGNLTKTNPTSQYTRGLKWLIGVEETDPAEIIDALRSNDQLRRKIAAAAAYRLWNRDSAPLHFATSIDDHEVVQFARDMLKRVS